jgi:predicted DNA-binding transcriptional regulator AlpA
MKPSDAAAIRLAPTDATEPVLERRAQGSPASECAAILVTLAERLAALAERLAAEERPDHLLTAQEAAARLSVSVDWLYDRAERLPFTVKLSEQVLRFSSLGLEAYIRTRVGRRDGRRERGAP